MILIDSNVIIDARDQASPFSRWAEELIASALADGELALNAIVLEMVSALRPQMMSAFQLVRISAFPRENRATTFWPSKMFLSRFARTKWLELPDTKGAGGLTLLKNLLGWHRQAGVVPWAVQQ